MALFAPYLKAQALALLCITGTATLGLLPGILTARIIDRAIPHRDVRELLLCVAGMVGVALISLGLGVVNTWFNSIVGEGVVRDVRAKLVTHLHQVPLTFFSATKSGAVMTRVSSDVDELRTIVSTTLPMMASNIAMIVTTIAAMFAWNWRLACIAVFILPLMIAPISPMGRRIYSASKTVREQRDLVESLAQETLSVSGVALVKSFTREAYEGSRFINSGTRLMQLEIRLATIGRWFSAAVGAMIILGPALIWTGGGWLSIRGALDVGVIVAFIGYIQGRLYAPLSMVLSMQAQLIGALAIFDRIFEYLDLPSERQAAFPAITGGIEDATVQFKDVCFSYHDERPALDAVSFKVNHGQIAAFVGPSGAGKSTLAALVARFYNPRSGQVLVAGHDLCDWDLEALRSQIGIVAQDTYLFHDSIRNNIRYAKRDAADEDIYAAAEAANIHELICRLPDGYDTVVGERGLQLSGGERQRVALARMFLKNPKILILDEATSALDSQNEAAIHASLETVMKGRTCLVIAHRLSTVAHADVIFVLDRGRIVESGTHEALLERAGLYATMFEIQRIATKNATVLDLSSKAPSPAY